MKKNLAFIVVLLPTLLLNGCNKPIHEHAIKVTNSPNEELVSLTAAGVEQMIKTKQTFPLLIYSSTCVSCEIADGYIAEYRSNNPVTLYRIEASYISELKVKLPEYFGGEFYTPDMFIFEKGVLTYKFTPSKFVNYSDFKAEANKIFLHSNITYRQKDFDLNKELTTSENLLVFVNDLEDEEAMNFYSEHFFELASNSNKNTLVLDYDSSLPSFADINQHKMYVYEEGKLKETYDYVTDSLSSINFINSYLAQ